MSCSPPEPCKPYTAKRWVCCIVAAFFVAGSPVACDPFEPQPSPDPPEALEALQGTISFNLGTLDVSQAEVVLAGVSLANDERVQLPTVTLAAALDSSPFAPDAELFVYDFVDAFDRRLSAELGRPLAFAELEQALLYACEQDDGLCLAWSDMDSNWPSLALQGGTWLAIPIDDAIQSTPLQLVNQREGTQPKLLGQTLWVDATASVGTRCIVSGGYLKLFLQQESWGAKLFADFGATLEDQAYQGSLYHAGDILAQERVLAKVRVTVFEDMIELVPLSAFHVMRLGRSKQAVLASKLSLDRLQAERLRYAGSLIQLEGLEMIDIDPNDPSTGWPAFGSKSKNITLSQTGQQARANLQIYEGTGIPGSPVPAPGFSLNGVVQLERSAVVLYPRGIEDIEPNAARVPGVLLLKLRGETLQTQVELDSLPTGTSSLADGRRVAVLSIASVLRAAELVHEPRRLGYKPVAYDGRKPFDKAEFSLSHSGMLYEDQPFGATEPSPLIASLFWPGAKLSPIYDLRGIVEIEMIRDTAPPAEGVAERGVGLTLLLDEQPFAIAFDGLQHELVAGLRRFALASFVSDVVIASLTMDGSFSPEQVKRLYDYRLRSWDKRAEATLSWDQMKATTLDDAEPYAALLDGQVVLEDVASIEMRRIMWVVDGDTQRKVYLDECEQRTVTTASGDAAAAVLFAEVLERAGYDDATMRGRFDVNLVASDEFRSFFPYGHAHLEAMYFVPTSNRGFTLDEAIAAYGGRVSTKSVERLELLPVLQGPPSLEEVVRGSSMWSTDPNGCDGCHSKRGEVLIPVDCSSCHTP